MRPFTRIKQVAAASLMVVTAGACAGNQLGNILGGVLGGNGQSSQLSGTIRGVDTRAQQIAIQQSNGETVPVTYDNQTQVVYQNQNYSPTSLENGDRVTARIQSNGSQYYTDYVQVDQSVSGPVSGSTATPSGPSPVPRSIARWMLSFGIDWSRAFWIAVARVALPSGSPPPSRAATVMRAPSSP